MNINPINTIKTNNINFKARIIPTQDLDSGFELIKKCVKTGTMKNLNFAKEFLDSIASINNSEELQKFKIEIDKRRAGYTYTKINNRRVRGGHNDFLPNIQDSYLVIEGTNSCAKKLAQSQPTVLDELKNKIETLEEQLSELKECYSRRIEAEIEQAQKLIFNN